MLKLKRLGVILIALAVVAAACGDDDDTSDPPAPTPTDAPAPTPTDAPAPTPTDAPEPMGEELVVAIAQDLPVLDGRLPGGSAASFSALRHITEPLVFFSADGSTLEGMDTGGVLGADRSSNVAVQSATGNHFPQW